MLRGPIAWEGNRGDHRSLTRHLINGVTAMAEDRTVEDRTVIVETPNRSSGSGWVIALVLIVALIVGVVFFTQMSGSEAAKDNAIANAAQDVGQAAQSVGDAAQDAANSAR
jgi:hypothetical protein